MVQPQNVHVPTCEDRFNLQLPQPSWKQMPIKMVLSQRRHGQLCSIFSTFFCWMETFTGVQGLCREGKFIVNLFGYTAVTAISHTGDGKILHHSGCIKPYENLDRLGYWLVPSNVWSYMASVMSLRKAAALQPEVDFPSLNFPSDLDPFIWQAPKNDWKLLPSVGTWLVT